MVHHSVEGGVKSIVEVAVNSKEENSVDFVPIMSKNLASGLFLLIFGVGVSTTAAVHCTYIQ